MPAIGAVLAAQAKLRLVRDTAVDGLLPGAARVLDVFGVDQRPAFVDGALIGAAGVLAPSLVDELEPARGCRREHDLRRQVGELAEALLALPPRGFAFRQLGAQAPVFAFLLAQSQQRARRPDQCVCADRFGQPRVGAGGQSFGALLLGFARGADLQDEGVGEVIFNRAGKLVSVVVAEFGSEQHQRRVGLGCKLDRRLTGRRLHHAIAGLPEQPAPGAAPVFVAVDV